MRFILNCLILSLILTFSLSHSANAADGSSGCGPGWYVLKDNSLVSSAVRAITNGILFPVSTIGMTFGTSNCTRHKIVQKERESLHFVTHNFYELQADAARGSGDYLQAYAHTIGCSPAAQARFNQQMKSRYTHIFSGTRPAPEQALTQTYVNVLTDSELARECGAI